ncbi:MAG: hypothetical protein A3K60_07475 [Euryarchaeota archaeon RBG_19FT_COMBO_56_21]|nr:MAG: hypothetical protein A3K60_07475 [Euryarchaeota archaeon RBG_19FT_COMBO_56_21]
MPSRIRTLDDETINRIAAGEVIERPASAVKELVENALDADATSVSISVSEGGKRLISVRDDGIGMSREDAQKAFHRHATSKITNINDLDTLLSYGFRGEALSSIAAVSRVTLRTREHGAPEGTMVVVDAGKIVSVSTAGCPPGTEVVVEELFSNIPARRKHLKSTGVELAHCRGVVESYLLCRPGISFSFRSDGQTEVVHVAAEGMKGSLSITFGPKMSGSMLFGSAETSGVRVEVFLGRLEHNRASPSDLRLFVNDRPVHAPKLVSAVVGAYGSKLMKDRYPIGVVRVLIDGASVDVNVHPAKREVRFEDESAVIGVVKSAVETALKEPDLTYKYDLTKFAESFGPPRELPDLESIKLHQTTLRIPASEETGQEDSVIVPLAQVMNTYILAESAGSLLLIDQHAASERIVYEQILKAIETGKEISQTLLTPLVVRLTSAETRVLEENRQALEKSGFKIVPFGKDAHALRSIPTVLGVAQGESALRNILADLARMAPSKKVGLDVIWRVACHTAIRAGEPLSSGQMRTLVADLVRTESPYTCEHGRPTMVVLSTGDLEKLFKRRV